MQIGEVTSSENYQTALDKLIKASMVFEPNHLEVETDTKTKWIF